MPTGFKRLIDVPADATWLKELKRRLELRGLRHDTQKFKYAQVTRVLVWKGHFGPATDVLLKLLSELQEQKPASAAVH